MSAVTKFEEDARKKVSMVQFFQPFANCNPRLLLLQASRPRRWKTSASTARSRSSAGARSRSPRPRCEPDFQLSDVISGRYDTYIREFATEAKAWGHPFFLRFNWEMNGSWFPWHEGVNGNQAGESVTAWRHVHDIFAAVGATNVDLGLVPERRVQTAAPRWPRCYPGDAYVDWTGLDGYNWGTNPAKPDSWKSFDQVYKPTYQTDRRNDRPVEADDDRRGRLDRVRRLEGGLDQGHARPRSRPTTRRSAPCSGSTNSTAAWTGRSRPPAAPPPPSPKASRARPTCGNTFAGLSLGAIQPPS